MGFEQGLYFLIRIKMNAMGKNRAGTSQFVVVINIEIALALREKLFDPSDLVGIFGKMCVHIDTWKLSLQLPSSF